MPRSARDIQLIELRDTISKLNELIMTQTKSMDSLQKTIEEMFDNLPHRQVPLDTLTDEEKKCPVCGTQMVPIGTETVRTELVFHPAYLERVDYMAATYECPACKDSLEPQFVKDAGAAPLVPHSYVSAGLAVHVMYGKFINALPCCRQEKDFENQFGMKIGRGTMAPWNPKVQECCVNKS